MKKKVDFKHIQDHNTKVEFHNVRTFMGMVKYMYGQTEKGNNLLTIRNSRSPPTPLVQGRKHKRIAAYPIFLGLTSPQLSIRIATEIVTGRAPHPERVVANRTDGADQGFVQNNQGFQRGKRKKWNRGFCMWKLGFSEGKEEEVEQRVLHVEIRVFREERGRSGIEGYVQGNQGFRRRNPSKYTERERGIGGGELPSRPLTAYRAREKRAVGKKLFIHVGVQTRNLNKLGNFLSLH